MTYSCEQSSNLPQNIWAISGVNTQYFFLALLGILANMPGSADQFSRPSGMGELGTIQNDNNLKGMTIHTRKECH